MKKLFAAVTGLLLSISFSQLASGQEMRASVQLGLRADGSWSAAPSASDVGRVNLSVTAQAAFPKALAAKSLAWAPVEHCVAYETRFDGEGDVRVCVQNEEWYQPAFASQDGQDGRNYTHVIQAGQAGGSVQTGFGQRALKTSALQATIENGAQPTTALPKVLVLEAYPEGSLVSSWFTGLKIANLNQSIDKSVYLDFEARVSLKATYALNEAAGQYELKGLSSAGSTYGIGALYYERNSACRDNACIAVLAPIASGRALDLK